VGIAGSPGDDALIITHTPAQVKPNHALIARMSGVLKLNLRWALSRMRGKLAAEPLSARAHAAWAEAAAIAEEEVAANRAPGQHGL